MKQRLAEFDLLRSIATLAVIGIHITAAYALVTEAGYLGNQLTRFAVPLFIIMSGYLLYYTDLNGHYTNIKDFYIKRFDKILWPYILWTLFYVLLTSYIARNLLTGLKNLPSHLLWGSGFYHLYFVVIIIQMYLLYPCLRYLIKKYPRSLLSISLIITLGMQTILNLATIGKIEIPHYNMLFLVYFPTWIFYFILGMISADNNDKWKQWLGQRQFLMGLIWLTTLGLLLLDSYYTGTYYSSSRPSIMLYAVSSYLFIYAVAIKYKEKVTVSITWFSNQSFLIYLIHPTFIMILVYLPTRFGMHNIWAGTTGMCLQYLAVLVLSIAATYIISLTPLADKLGGAKPKKRD